MAYENPETRTDDLEMSAYLAGDARAFDAIFRRYSPVLLQYFRRRHWQSADCQDLVQQTFLQLHRARGEFRPGERLRPWLFTIARNVGCDHARRIARRSEQASDVDRQPAREEVSSPALARFDARLLGGALALLSSPERRLLDEHFAQDRSFGELASRDGIRPATLRVRAHRARAKLRALLSDCAA